MASDLKSLRSLKLMGYKMKKLPISLGKLKHLKYLDISSTKVSVLPKSFSKLYHLQTSNFGYCCISLPSGTANLISLRHVYSVHPRDISIMQLTSLRTLTDFVVGTKKGSQIEDLGCLSQLRGKLMIFKLQHVRSKLEASKANLKEKTKLHQLALYWSRRHVGAVNNNNDEERFPSWMGNDVNSSGSSFLLYNMVELLLINCNECTCTLSFGLLPSLKVLYIERMENVRRMVHKLQPGGAESIRLFLALKTLTVCHMKRLEEWVEVVEDATTGGQGVVVFPCLKKLLIYECPLLKTWSMGGFSSHHKRSERLGIDSCTNLISNPEDIGKLHSLNVLSIMDCKNLRSIPGEWLASLTCLKRLHLGPFWSELEDFPGLTSLHQLHASLEELALYGWDKLESLPHQLQHLTTLKELKLWDFNGPEALPEWLGDLSCLHRLHIRNCSNLTHLPHQLRHLIALKELCLSDLNGLDALPEWLGYLSSLYRLEIGNCSNLTHLPSIEAMRRLFNLQHLGIWGSPKLKKRCAKKRGPEWSKISHILKLGKFGFEDEQWIPTRTFPIVEEMGKAKWTPPTLDMLTC
ncbi:hypothetical protein SLEP1_g55592 [Rubroshorea leprosula]|uniref:Disease resistance R13L4/SHOC-2-like LRR domain-containing protein n=1 Tax=Rubroshorea leprosula TaxID=152421 RepID=A0AAV5MG74_9ROSI|nr:hypothetical protein SLEP1_g55592 [Rubroshorea leprosula]